MTSNITDASQDELINLIYHHLKDNGYQKAAHVLRKHAPQVETEEVKVPLSKIFQKWASSDDGDIPPVPSGVETPELQGPAKRKGTKSKITAPSAGLNPKEPAGIITTLGSTSKSLKQKKNETETKPRKKKTSNSEDVLVPPSAGAAPSNMNDSDSDSSLDVDKWRKLLSQFSDVDREKMDVLSILDESSGITATRTRKPRKPRPSKRAENQAKKGKSDTEAEIATAKSDDISVTTNASNTSSKKLKDKDAEVSKVKTPPKKTGNKKNSSTSGLDVVETPKRTKAKKNKSSFDQDETEKAEEHHEKNRLLERTEVGVSASEAIETPKRVHFEPNNSFSQQVETPETANAWNGNSTSKTSFPDIPSKKAKKKKGRSGASDVETVSSLSNIQEVVKDVKKAAVETDCEETNLTTDRSGTHSKKVKNKKSKSVVEPVPNEIPSKKVKAKKTESPSEIDQETTSESVNPGSSSKKAKPKANERLSETLESETPSTKSKAVKEAGGAETPSKKPKAVLSDADSLQSDSTNVSLKKRKRKLAAVGVAIQHDVPSETPVKSQSQAQTQDNVANGLGNEDTSSQELKTTKKRKRKLAAVGVGIQHDIPSETPVKSQSHAQTQDDVANGLGNEETSSQELKTPKKRKRKVAADGVEIQHDVPSETPVKSRSQAQTQDDVANGSGNEETSSQELKTPKKRKRKVAADGVEIQLDVPSETPVKSRSQVQTQDDVADGLGNEETSSQELKTPKKRKRKVAADGVEIQHDVPSETPGKSRSQAQTQDDVADGLGNEETSSLELKTPSKKNKKNKREEACDVLATPGTKKDKVKNKKMEAGNAEDALQPPPPEEEATSVPVAMSQKKKKKKKEKEREETEEIVPDDPPVSAPVEEVAVHKKKKKKQLSSDEAHGLNST